MKGAQGRAKADEPRPRVSLPPLQAFTSNPGRIQRTSSAAIETATSEALVEGGRAEPGLRAVGRPHLLPPAPEVRVLAVSGYPKRTSGALHTL